MPSLLEERFSHVIPGLTQSWGSADQFERFIGTLFFDSRWDRKGWPRDAWEELMFLQALHRVAFTEQYPKRYEMEDEIRWV